MTELLMIYCLLGGGCVTEVVATFPQWDVGGKICEMARPGVEMGIRARVPAAVTVTFKCEPVRGSEPKPQGNVRFLTP